MSAEQQGECEDHPESEEVAVKNGERVVIGYECKKCLEEQYEPPDPTTRKQKKDQYELQ